MKIRLQLMSGVMVSGQLDDGTLFVLDGARLEIVPRFDTPRERALVLRGTAVRADDSVIEGSSFALRVSGETGLPIYVKKSSAIVPKIDGGGEDEAQS